LELNILYIGFLVLYVFTCFYFLNVGRVKIIVAILVNLIAISNLSLIKVHIDSMRLYVDISNFIFMSTITNSIMATITLRHLINVVEKNQKKKENPQC
jgi:hypothetical protein